MRLVVIAASLLVSAPALAQAPAAPATQPCADPEFHRLDFWVGKWDVYPTGKDKLVAHSLIERSTAAASARTGCRSATSRADR